MTLFKGIPVQYMLEMSPLPIKSTMSSTSAAAAQSTDWSSLLSAYSPQSHSFQQKDITVYMKCGKETLSVKPLFSPLPSCFSLPFLLLFPLVSCLSSPLQRPLARVSASVWSFAVRSQQTAVSGEDEGSAQGDRYLKHVSTHTQTNTHIQSHLSCYFYTEEQQLCLDWKWGRQAYRCWEKHPVFIYPPLLSRCLSHSLCSSLYRNSGIETPPLPRGSNQW